MSNFKSIIIFFLIFGCSNDKSQIISNIPEDFQNQNYKLNLRSYNSGEKLESIRIIWNEIAGDVYLKNLSNFETITVSNSSYTYEELEADSFLNIEVNANKDGLSHIDTIQIFTRSVYPVTNFVYTIEEPMRGDGIYNEGEEFIDADESGFWNEGENFIDSMKKQYHRKLSWTQTIEKDDNFNSYHIFRSEDPKKLLDISNCMNCEIDVLTLKSDSIYIDSSIVVINQSSPHVFYYMVQVSANNFSKNSFIYNYTGFNQPSKVNFSKDDVSKNKKNYIDLKWKWNTSSDSTFFYQYEIYRASDNNLTDITQIAKIPKVSIEYFQDRNAGSGTTWFYSVAVVDVNGRKNFSNYFPGWTYP